MPRRGVARRLLYAASSTQVSDKDDKEREREEGVRLSPRWWQRGERRGAASVTACERGRGKGEEGARHLSPGQWRQGEGRGGTSVTTYASVTAHGRARRETGMQGVSPSQPVTTHQRREQDQGGDERAGQRQRRQRWGARPRRGRGAQGLMKEGTR